MRVLLDTHILLWATDAPNRLGAETRATLENPDNDVFFSAASIWEIAIKAGLNRADFRYDPAEIVRSARETGFVEMPVRAEAAARVALLPTLHKDPFDRLLIAQAMLEPMRLLTADRSLLSYGELVVLAA